MLSEDFILEHNKKIIDEIALTKNLSKNTVLSYQSILKEYSMFHDMLIIDLLNEADCEEQKGIILKNRKIKKRILSYKNHLIYRENQPLTINTKIAKIKSLYSFYDIELPYIPYMLKKNHETINDIPSVEDIKLVLNNTENLRFKAIILFLLSSGNSLNETLNITIGDFIDSTKSYHNKSELVDCLDVLESQSIVIPTFYMFRKKTNYPYISFCSNESTKYIIKYLRTRIKDDKNIDRNNKLFDIKEITVQSHFRRINDKLGFGYSGQYRFFHAHALRKFFATELLKADLDIMTINFLSGRSIDKTQQAYFKADPERLKNKYMDVVNSLTIFDKYKITKHENNIFRNYSNLNHQNT